MSAPVIADLIERVGRAEGPDRPLDDRIHAAFVERAGWNVPNYTASIDAALALVERMLPGTMRAVGNMEGGPFCRLVYPSASKGWDVASSLEQEGGAQTEPLAILAALLTALQSQTPGPTGASNKGGGHVG